MIAEFFRWRGILPQQMHRSAYAEIRSFYLTTVVAATLFALYGSWFALAAWVETDELLATDLPSLLAYVTVPLFYGSLVWVFLLKPLFETHGVMAEAKSRALASRERRLVSSGRRDIRNRPTELLAESDLIERMVPEWPLPIEQVRVVLFAIAVPLALFALNLLRFAVQVAD